MAAKKNSAPATVAEYIESRPPEHQRLLRRVRTILRQAIPEAEECISYGMPTYKIEGKAAIHFAGWKAHFSLYPVTAALVQELAETLERAKYEIEKGTIRIAYEGTMPTHFIQRVARLRTAAVLSRRKG
ncbi:MAG: DUF1801 domain-containing protein [Polyangiaceae bacterium]